MASAATSRAPASPFAPTFHTQNNRNPNLPSKIAPKAVIADDGDIDIDSTKRLLTKQAHFYRENTHRQSMRLPSEAASMIQRDASERLSHRIIPSITKYLQQFQSNQTHAANPALRNTNYQTKNYPPFWQTHYQNQLAAAAAAAVSNRDFF